MQAPGLVPQLLFMGMAVTLRKVVVRERTPRHYIWRRQFSLCQAAVMSARRASAWCL